MKKSLPRLVLMFAVIVVSASLFFGSNVPVGEGQSACNAGSLLGFYSDNNLRFGSENRIVRMGLNETVIRSSETILTSFAEALSGDVDVDITARGLPNGVRLEEEVVQSSGVGEVKYFFLTGTPTEEGEFEVELEAESPGCEDDEGKVFVRVDRVGNYARCTLTTSGAVGSGGSATLSWQVTGGPVLSASMHPSIPGNPSALRSSGSGQTGPLTEDTEFTLTVTTSDETSECSAEVLVGGTSGNTTQFVRTLLDMPTILNGGGQFIQDAIYWNGRFVFSGSCGVNMSSTAVGGGLWTVKEDGSGTIQERQACIDAGSITNSIYHHGLVDGATLHPDGNRGFVRGNSSWASCVVKGTDPFQSGQDCAQFGPGANRAVYYGAEGDGGVRIMGISPARGDSTAEQVASGYWQIPDAVAGGYVLGVPRRSDRLIAGLPSWMDSRSVSEDISSPFGFGDYFIARTSDGYKVYDVQNGSLRQIQDLTGDPDFIYHTIDPSTTPERLVIYKPYTRNDRSRKILTYEATATGLKLVSEREVPRSEGVSSLTDNPTTIKGGFAVYGEYTIWPERENDGFSVWRNGEKVDTIRLPKGGFPYSIVASRNGYVAVTAVVPASDGRRTAAYLYRLGGVTPPPPGQPGFPPTGPTTPPSGIIPGQLLEITYPAGQANPEILIRFAILNSVTQGNMNLSIYDQPYSVNTENAQLYRFNYSPATLSDFVPGSFVNIFGTLDTENGTSINASVVRNPLPSGATPTGGGGAPAPSNASGASNTFTPAPTAPSVAPAPAPAPTAASQNSLNSLEQLLQELQQRFAQ